MSPNNQGKQQKLAHETTAQRSSQRQALDSFSAKSNAAQYMPGPAITRAESTVQIDHAATRHAIEVRNQLGSPLLQLPSEIRNQIYYYALGGHEIYLMPSGSRKRTLRCRPKDQKAWNLKPITEIMAINLSLACRQIRRELGGYFAFTFNSFGAMTGISSMLESFPVDQRDKIEVITTNYTHTFDRTWLDCLLDLSMLESLKLLVLRDLDGNFTTIDAKEKEETLSEFRKRIRNEELKIVIMDMWN